MEDDSGGQEKDVPAAPALVVTVDVPVEKNVNQTNIHVTDTTTIGGCRDFETM